MRIHPHIGHRGIRNRGHGMAFKDFCIAMAIGLIVAFLILGLVGLWHGAFKK